MATTSEPAAKKIKLDETNNETKKVGVSLGRCNAVHGWTYQLKVLILIYVKAVACKYQEFYLNTENEEEFGKFDDAIFKYVIKVDSKDKTFIRLVQIKHVKDERLKIQYEDLRPRPKKKIKKVEEKESFKLGTKYTLTTYFESFINCKKKDVENLILYTNLSFGYDVLTDLFVEFQKPDDIFDVSLPDHRNIAKPCLPWAYNERDSNKIPKKYKLDYDKLKSDEILHQQFIDIINKQTSPPENSIEKFCEKFIFATGQPNDNEMNFVLENEIARISELPRLGLVYAEYLNIFLCWLDNKYDNGDPLTPDDMNHIIPLTKLKAENFIISTDYHERLKDLKYDLVNPTIKKVENYFKEENSDENFVQISTKFPKLTLAKVFQCFEYDEKRYKGECLILDVQSNEIIEEKAKLIEYFKFCVIIFQVKVAEDYKNKILEMLEKNKTKVVILNTTSINCEPEDNCCFKYLQPESKTKILERKVSFDNEDFHLKKFGLNDLFDNMQDAVWLSELIDGKLIIKKTNLPSSKDNYIERMLIVKPKLISENSMTHHCRRLVILTSEAGYGKTTLISSISKKYTNCWTEIIKLTQHVTVLPSYQTHEDVIEFIVTQILNYDSFTAQLFKQQIEAMETVVIMFDGFDEIDQKSKDAVLIIIENLLKTKVHRIWIATRPISEQSLQDYFSQPTIQLATFSDENVFTVISHYWSKNEMEYEKKKLNEFCRNLLRDYKINFRVPLYTKMAAEYFKPIDCLTDFKQLRNKNYLYEICVRKKMMHFLDSKIGHIDDGHRASSSNNNFLIKNYNDWHKQLALQMLCPEYGFKHNLDPDDIEIINSIGIATVNVDDNNIIHFDHRTFAEYFLAKYVFDLLTDKGPIDTKIVNLLLIIEKYLHFREVCRFLDAFFDNSEILPNKIKLVKPENIEMFKMMLNSVFRGTSIHKGIFLFISLDNVDVMKYKLDEMIFLEHIIVLRSVNILKKYFIELEKQLTSQQLKEFIILNIVRHFNLQRIQRFVNSFKTDDGWLNFLYKLLEEKFPEIYKIVSDYLSSDKNETAFMEFFTKIIKSKSVDNFLFSIYSLASSIRKEFSNESKEYILEHLIKASEKSQFDFDVNGKYLKELQFNSSKQWFFYYKNLIRAFKNQKEDFMNFLQILETVLSFDEFEMLLTDNVDMIPEKIKNIIKGFGIFLLAQRYMQFSVNGNDLKSYYDKFLKYNNEELMAVSDWIQLPHDQIIYEQICTEPRKDPGNYIQNIKYKHKVINRESINKLKQPEFVIDLFYDTPFLFMICYVQFLKSVEAPSLVVYEKVFDDISEMHTQLVKHEILGLLKKVLELNSLELLKKIIAAVYTEIYRFTDFNATLRYQLAKLIYCDRYFDTMAENSEGIFKKCLLDFLNTLKEKIDKTEYNYKGWNV